MRDIFDGNEIVDPKSNVNIPLSVNFTPDNPGTINPGISSIHPNEEPKKPFEAGLQEEPYHAGVFEEAKAQFSQESDVQKVHRALEQHAENASPLNDDHDANWKPTDDQSAFEGVQGQNLQYILDSTGPKDQRRRYNHVLDLQQKDELIKNGSTAGWAIGGGLGLTIGSPEISMIPIIGQVKYARYAPTILATMARTLPTVALTSAMHQAAVKTEDINGNLENFLVDTAADTAFGTLFMGAQAGAERLIDSAAMWEVRKAILPYYHGIDFLPKVNAENEMVGFTAFDRTGNLSAAQVSFAQDYADSSLAKSGIFKIPYLGEGTLKVFGAMSPLVRMTNSRFETVRGYVQRIADSSFTTLGVKKGLPKPNNFENMWNQLQGSNRAIDTQINALHVERNGFDISNRVANSVKNMTAKVSKSGYISKEDFGKEIRNVLINETPSEHSSVNQAAQLLRTHIDDSWKSFRSAYNLPEDWIDPKTARGYLMRVYNTPYMIGHENEWHNMATGWLRDADKAISTEMEPINNLKIQIEKAAAEHENFRRQGLANESIKVSADQLSGMRHNLAALEYQLQNKIRSDDSLRIHAEDLTKLSGRESEELKGILKPSQDKEKLVNEQQAIVTNLKGRLSNKKLSSEKVLEHDKELAIEEAKLHEIKNDHEKELISLQERAHKGDINSLYYDKEPNSFVYKFKDPNDRLRLRDIHASDEERMIVSKAAYNTILNQNPEQTISNVMDKMRGVKENPLKQRTLMIPDHLLYDSNMLSHDIMANVSNYRNFLGRRTFVKSIFNDVTIDGGIESVIGQFNKEYQASKSLLNENLSKVADARKELKEALEKGEKAKTSVEALDKRQDAIEQEILRLHKDFKSAEEDMSLTYDKMMGKKMGTAKANRNSRMIMAYTAAIRLGFVPFTMVSDLAANILQHGLWPFIRDGIVPALESLGGLLKTKDSEALRKAAPHVHLALQDVLMGYAEKNYGTLSTPYINMGHRVANGLEGIAHLSSNLTGTTYAENGLQHITAAIMQGKIMEAMFEHKAGTLSKDDLEGLLKYGLDPKEWADKFIAAFNKHGGGKTRLGGYQSKFWEWSDLEASNKFGDAVFRGVKDTVLARGIVDAPFFMDNPIGSILLGFKGWTFASLNRYVIPSMQAANAQKLMGISFMLTAGAMVSPMRRLASGKSPYPDNVTPGQIAYAAFQDSGYFSIFGDMLSDINLFSGGVLNKDFMGNLKNDRYRDRTLAGLLGPSAGVAQDLYSVAGMVASGELNQNDVDKLMRLVPFTQLTEFRGLTNYAVDSLKLPKTRAQAAK